VSSNKGVQDEAKSLKVITGVILNQNARLKRYKATANIRNNFFFVVSDLSVPEIEMASVENESTDRKLTRFFFHHTRAVDEARDFRLILIFEGSSTLQRLY